MIEVWKLKDEELKALVKQVNVELQLREMIKQSKEDSK